MQVIDHGSHLSTTERFGLLVPAAGGALFGLLAFVFGSALAPLVGFPGNDAFIHRLAGAAALGYIPALWVGFRRGEWVSLRLVVIATFVFNLGSLYGCLVQILSGNAPLVVYAILLASVAIIAITGAILLRHSASPRGAGDIPQLTVYTLGLGTALSFVFGIVPLVFPVQAGMLVGMKATDPVVYRQGAAATFGYAIAGILALRSRAWNEMRLLILMGFIFNGLALIASLIALVEREPLLLPVLVGAAALVNTLTAARALRRAGT